MSELTNNSVVLVVVLAFLVLAVLVLFTMTNQRRRSDMLRSRFGPEYNRTVEQRGDRRKAEQELSARAQRVKAFAIHAIAPQQRGQFADSWRATQAHFVDDPSGAIKEANQLVARVMEVRGYPVGNFEQRAADLSVDHAVVVDNYRAAHEIAQRNARGQASTEDLRQAMVYYRNLFNDLLETNQPSPTAQEMKK